MTNEDAFIDGYRTAIQDVRRAADDWLAAQPRYGADYSPVFVVRQLLAFVQRHLLHVAAGILVDPASGDDRGLVPSTSDAREVLERFDAELERAAEGGADYGRLAEVGCEMKVKFDRLLMHVEGTP